MNTTGFKPLFDECSLTFGATHEEDTAEVQVTLGSGETRTVDAIGVDEQAGEATIFGFTWQELTEDVLSKADLTDEERQQYLGETFMMLEFVGPFANVEIADMDSGGVFS